MQAFIVCDLDRNVATSMKVREILLKRGLDPAAAPVVSLERAASRLSTAACDLLVVILSPNPEIALPVLAELRGQSQAYIVAVGLLESRLVLRSITAGAKYYVDENNLQTALEEALRLMPTQEGNRQGSGQVICVLAPSGGSGSSTVAVNLATVLANENRSALLVDLRLETNDLASMMDLRPSHTLAELCQTADRMDKEMFERSLVRHASGVRLLAPPASYADARQVTPQGVSQAIARGREQYPFVVVDLDNSLREEQLKALREADLILIVMRLEFACLRNTQRTLDYLDRMGINRDRVLLVVNRFGQPKEVPAAKAVQALGVTVFEYIPEDARTVNLANNNGVPVVLESPSAKVSKALVRLAQNVSSRLKAK